MPGRRLKETQTPMPEALRPVMEKQQQQRDMKKQANHRQEGRDSGASPRWSGKDGAWHAPAANTNEDAIMDPPTWDVQPKPDHFAAVEQTRRSMNHAPIDMEKSPKSRKAGNFHMRARGQVQQPMSRGFKAGSAPAE